MAASSNRPGWGNGTGAHHDRVPGPIRRAASRHATRRRRSRRLFPFRSLSPSSLPHSFRPPRTFFRSPDRFPFPLTLIAAKLPEPRFSFSRFHRRVLSRVSAYLLLPYSNTFGSSETEITLENESLFPPSPSLGTSGLAFHEFPRKAACYRNLP
ncbi:hypothetical protein PUN28_014258 [Cardiocondyla obscurior]|uniref:Uncharacterized protein n=1 Tax=Cardiocondyla obscurior TaxID=286306 RepID=A0AAW2F0W0_9HYME